MEARTLQNRTYRSNDSSPLFIISTVAFRISRKIVTIRSIVPNIPTFCETKRKIFHTLMGKWDIETRRIRGKYPVEMPHDASITFFLIPLTHGPFMHTVHRFEISISPP